MMEEALKIEAVINGELQLPEFIIQRIQSFLTGEEAAQTTVLSKSWCNAWLTRPNLDFDEHDFKKDDDDNYHYRPIDELLKFAKKTIQRYGDLNLKIESLRLCITASLYGDSDLVTKLIIVKALKMGATTLILEFDYFVLSHDLLRSESLVRLFVSRCKIDIGMDQKVRCPKLESLSLDLVEIESEMISNIISCCPLIKTLSLSQLFDPRYPERLMNQLHRLHHLRCLVMVFVKVDTTIFVDFSSKFPSLKDLTLHYCSFQEEIQICSPSLENLNIVDYRHRDDIFHKRLRGKFEVPSIRRFIFESSTMIPSLSIKSTSREWQSHVYMKGVDDLSTSWFFELNKFLRALRGSKVYLSLHSYSERSFNYEMEDIQCELKPEVENLTLDVDYLPTLSRYALFDGLFRSCRPKLITKNLLPGKSKNDLLYMTLVRGMNRKGLIPSDLLYSLRDLEEINVEIFEESVAEWRPLPLELMVDDSTDEPEVRCHLKWRS